MFAKLIHTIGRRGGDLGTVDFMKPDTTGFVAIFEQNWVS
jgi:hypothetical protein